MTGRLLKLSAFCLFLGWGYLHIVWDIPYRALFWSEDYLKWFIELLGYSWTQYVTSPGVDDAITLFTRIAGWIFILFAIVAAFVPKVPKPIARILIAGTVWMGFIAFLQFKESSYRLGMLLEYAGQVMSPLILYWYYYRSETATTKNMFNIMLVTIALTFTCHGLFAVGFYPVPGAYLDMFIAILGTTEPQARVLLQIAGVMDILLSIAIFIKPIQKYALLYAVVWGALTTMSRPISYLGFGGISDLAFWLAQALYRVPHVALPLATFYYLKELRTQPK